MKYKNNLVYLSHKQLDFHPKNMRRIYPPMQIREMAESIKECGGIIVPLRIVPGSTRGRYYVIDGNIRLAGARLLGDECPQFKCEIVNETQAQQLLDMAITAKVRYDPNPIDEACHYQRLIKKEKIKVTQIARSIGKATSYIYGVLSYLKLDVEIQELIADRKIPAMPKIVPAFLSISPKSKRIKLAQSLAERRATFQAILVACEQIKRIEIEKDAARHTAPSLAISQKLTKSKIPQSGFVPLDSIRDAANAMCSACVIKEDSLADVAEPAWTLIRHAAESTCAACGLGHIEGICEQCPGVEMLRQMLQVSKVARNPEVTKEAMEPSHAT